MAEEETVVRELERAKPECLDCIATVFLDGWILGLSEGHTCRANSVNPIYGGIRGLPDKIPICEETFSDHQLLCVFKVIPTANETGLDDLLSARGYEK